MKTRALGKSGIEVSEIGFGAWGIGGRTPGATSYGETDDAVSRHALEEAFDEGITFFDTANVYGDGHSETLLGQVFGRRRASVVLSTKAGCDDYQAPLDFSPAALTRSLDGSLRRLGTDYVDLFVLHDPKPDEAGLDETFAHLDRLKRDGKVRAIGVSVRTPEDATAFLQRFTIEALQINLNLLDQRAVDLGTLHAARAQDCSVIARTPLCFGFLSERLDEGTTFDAADHRSRWPATQIQRWHEGRRLFRKALGADQSIAVSALRFCLSFKAVATVIPGILTPEEARHNARASDIGPLSEDELAEVRRIYADHAFFIERPSGRLAMGDK
jgi:aryl-alcohol dehydrogenase-like predicted oxidoreductase